MEASFPTKSQVALWPEVGHVQGALEAFQTEFGPFWDRVVSRSWSLMHAYCPKVMRNDLVSLSKEEMSLEEISDRTRSSFCHCDEAQIQFRVQIGDPKHGFCRFPILSLKMGL
jgi:hypothetical protein